MFQYFHKKSSPGFTLLELIIGMGIFAVVSVSIYIAYSNILDLFIASELNSIALSVINNELEVIRNMSYEDVGLINGVPPGKLLAEKTVMAGDIPFIIKTTVKNVDDPFDGTLEGNPSDPAPADYKLVAVEASCTVCARFISTGLTTTIAPVNLENATKNGALYISVFNASGQPVNNATVSIINTKVSPNINITDTTDANGMLNFIDIATSSLGYKISVSKSGYSSDRTYTPGDVTNPNPIKPDATVLKQQVTKISFAIDRVSTVNLNTQDIMCKPVANVGFLQTGAKLIGTPNVYKYSTALTTDSSGHKTVSNLEWDTYTFKNTDATREISGLFMPLILAVNPNTTQSMTWVMELKAPSALLVTVKDQSGNAINDATLTLTKASFNQSLLSGRKSFGQTDWSDNQYYIQSGSIEADDPAGDLHLVSVGGQYATSSQEWLESSTFDLGSSVTAFFNLSWNPTSQPSQAGQGSLKFQVATNNDNGTWNYIGPDGTANSFYSASGGQISGSNNGGRYLRYKVYMKTDSVNHTPTLNDLTISFRSGCFPEGQAYFSGLATGTYKLTVQKSGFQTLTVNSISVGTAWQQYNAILTP